MYCFLLSSLVASEQGSIQSSFSRYRLNVLQHMINDGRPRSKKMTSAADVTKDIEIFKFHLEKGQLAIYNYKIDLNQYKKRFLMFSYFLICSLLIFFPVPEGLIDAESKKQRE